MADGHFKRGQSVRLDSIHGSMNKRLKPFLGKTGTVHSDTFAVRSKTRVTFHYGKYNPSFDIDNKHLTLVV